MVARAGPSQQCGRIGEPLNLGREVILDQMRAGQIDLAVYTGTIPAPGGFLVEVLGPVPCSLYAAPALAAAVGNDPAAISAAPFVLPNQGSMVAWISEALERADIRPTNVIALSQFGNVLADIVRDGRGIGLLFDEHVHSSLRGQVQRLPIAIDPALRLMVRTGAALHPAVQPCMDALKKIVAPIQM